MSRGRADDLDQEYCLAGAGGGIRRGGRVGQGQPGLTGELPGAAQDPGGEPPFDRIAVIINRRAGMVRRAGVDRVAEAFRSALGARLCYLHVGTGRDVAPAVRRALDEGARCILPIGGDGTCTAVAEMARARGFIASALPGGTKNILAKRLWGGTATLFDIAERCAAGHVKIRRMDAGDANGRLFFVGASFGLIPHLARAREKLRGRAEPSGVFAALRHVLRLGRRGLFQPRVSYARPGKDSHRCAALMASVKSIDEVLRRPGEKDDPASFDCAAASPQGWWQLVWLGLRAVFTDTWRNHAAIDVFNAPQLEVNGPGRLVVALDGEAIVLAPPVKLTMLQDAIPMLGSDGSRPGA